MKKILLIHGWNYENYYGKINHESWENRKKFIENLEEYYIVKSPDLPGFGLEPEPNVKGYKIEDYAKFIKEYIEKNNFYPDYILGYSFGGAVAVEYQKDFDNSQKLILVSPALIRNNNNSRSFIQTPSYLEPLRNYIRDLYLIYKVKVPEMVYGTKFLRNTYQSIVRIELLNYLEKMDPNNFIIIYGNLDDMVDPNRLFNSVTETVKERIRFIENGGHDIANTHTRELIEVINDFVDSKEKSR